MEKNVNMLELLLRPAFCVRDGTITHVNRAAAQHLIAPGTAILELIASGQEEYAAFSEGRLCLTLQIHGQNFAASVMPQDGSHIFVLEQDAIDAHLQSMALVAQELRTPLTGMMSSADKLFGSLPQSSDAAQMNRRLYQLLRLVGNMSDAARFTEQQPRPKAYADISALLDEVFQKAIPLAAESGKQLRYEGLSQQVFSLADSQLLERAAYNLISNAMKFSPDGAPIIARLTKNGKFLRFTIEDQGRGIDAGIQGNLFSRYLRKPGLEDPCHGLGLGLLLVRLAAATHGGTVLIDHPRGIGTRITMTLAIYQDSKTAVRCPGLTIDYAGERDHALVELSDVLLPHLYQPNQII